MILIFWCSTGMILMYQDNRVFDLCLTKMITLGEKEKKNWPCRDCCGVGDRSCGCNFSTDSWKPPLQPQLHNKVDTIIQYVEREAHYKQHWYQQNKKNQSSPLPPIIWRDSVCVFRLSWASQLTILFLQFLCFFSCLSDFSCLSCHQVTTKQPHSDSQVVLKYYTLLCTMMQ